ncbi:ATP-binding cassette domain-containing protein [Azohydromonas sediminis]|uniref:ATP-binding cassette domain-containing protein n=1 Tax=Azohydromonas sediminis TaxID=2259674 RepID=UPI000E65808D|nr:ATP-binding cassette domain-containing protein [Azohydromonas sediminis]
MTGAPLIELEHATVRFGTRVALYDVTLAVHAGERIALVGANGSGKTTLLRLLHGQLQPHLASGVRRTARGADGCEPRQAMLFQRPFLLRLSVRRNVELALWLAGVRGTERRERALAALAHVGLRAEADRPARVLSGGQQQRVALARAWAVRPQVLFLDEPTASLDPHARRDIEALVAEFAAEGMTVVMSSHHLGQVRRLASRVIYLEQGRLVVDRPTAGFFDDPLPDEAALFLQGELP